MTWLKETSLSLSEAWAWPPQLRLVFIVLMITQKSFSTKEDWRTSDTIFDILYHVSLQCLSDLVKTDNLIVVSDLTFLRSTVPSIYTTVTPYWKTPSRLAPVLQWYGLKRHLKNCQRLEASPHNFVSGSKCLEATGISIFIPSQTSSVKS